MTTRFVTVQMPESLVPMHELIFRSAAQSGLFQPGSRARFMLIADRYGILRIAIEDCAARGIDLPPGVRLIVESPEQLPGFEHRAVEDLEQSEPPKDEGGAGWGG